MRKFPTAKGRLYFGPKPDLETLHALKARNVSTIWNLAAELDEILRDEIDIFGEENVIHSDIEDFSIPNSLDSFVRDMQNIHKRLEDEGSVFVHCYGGRGRTGMALACIASLENSGEIAIRLAKIYCNGPELKSQIEFVKRVKDYG